MDLGKGKHDQRSPRSQKGLLTFLKENRLIADWNEEIEGIKGPAKRFFWITTEKTGIVKRGETQKHLKLGPRKSQSSLKH